VCVCVYIYILFFFLEETEVIAEELQQIDRCYTKTWNM